MSRNRPEASVSIEQEIRDYVRKEFLFNRTDVEVTEDQALIEEGIIDSVGILQLVGFIERRFGVSVKPEDLVLRNFESVRAIKNLIQSSQARKG